ncbi:MAG: DUF5615 family PIN-like protein [Halobacteriota archaeon]
MGYEAIRANEIGMARAKDVEIMEYAAEHDFVVITADLDFGEILAFTKHKKPSVIIFRLMYPSPEKANSSLKFLPRIADALRRGSIVIVEDERFRVRELPVDRSE